jgi:hypothetical protein
MVLTFEESGLLFPNTIFIFSDILWNDSELQIDWPSKNPILSEKDSQLPLFEKAENNFVYHEL